MANDNTPTLTPKLRFPAFRRQPGWNPQSLGSVCDLKAGDFVPASAIRDLESDDLFPCYGGNGLRGYVASFTHDGLYVLVGRQGALCGNVNLISGRFHATEHALVATPKPDIDVHWLYYALTGLKLNQFAIGQAQPGLSVTVLNGVDMFVPATPPEQRKIADCLTSLDELIAAQGRKVAALVAHKKGLMQRLFPRNGETIPRLRFPEFRNAPEWGNRKLGQVIEIASGQVDPTESPYCDLPHIGGENIESESGNILNVRTAREDGVISGKYPFDANDILYSKIRPALNKIAAPDFIGVCSADIYPIRPSGSDIQRDFLVYLLRSDLFVKYATKHSERGKIPKINREALDAYEALLPQPDEQQSIAACLSALDAQIAAENDKLAVLKTHKQGLMQQLFPSPVGN